MNYHNLCMELSEKLGNCPIYVHPPKTVLSQDGGLNFNKQSPDDWVTEEFTSDVLFEKVQKINIQNLITNEIYDPQHHNIIIHTDQGRSFCSKVYHDYINNCPYLQGSMSPPHSPTSNAVVEGWHFAFKERLTKFGQKISQIHHIRKIEDLNVIIAKKVNNINSFYKSDRSMWKGAANLIQIFNTFHLLVKNYNVKVVEPEIMAPSADILPFEFNTDLQEIQKFRHNVINLTEESEKISQNLETKLDLLIKNFGFDIQVNLQNHLEIKNQLSDLSKQLKILEKQNNLILKKAGKTKSTNKKIQLERPPLTVDLFLKLINISPTTKFRTVPFHRFKLYLIILFFRGLRINEIGHLTKNDFKSLSCGQSVFSFQKV